MARIVLLHAALGLTHHVHDWADALRGDGHDVDVPDMFEGRTFHDLDTGTVFADGEGGPHAFVPVVEDQLRGLRGPVVYAGFSLGGSVAALLAMRSAHAAGVVMMSGLILPEWLDGEQWPGHLPAQLHRADEDPWVPQADVSALMTFAGGQCEEFEYPGSGHLFGFEGWHEYDDEASHRMFEHVGDFLADFY
ncbi:dienelactone hydrolase family protein [Demequina sp. SO4-18]|uniref:dienelactone hydrolase family protein n=1 Tax=Demequina sp. SO4-18 TaxID=3401026 RepID=UPI003B5B55D7